MHQKKIALALIILISFGCLTALLKTSLISNCAVGRNKCGLLEVSLMVSSYCALFAIISLAIMDDFKYFFKQRYTIPFSAENHQPPTASEYEGQLTVFEAENNKFSFSGNLRLLIPLIIVSFSLMRIIQNDITAGDFFNGLNGLESFTLTFRTWLNLMGECILVFGFLCLPYFYIRGKIWKINIEGSSMMLFISGYMHRSICVPMGEIKKINLANGVIRISLKNGKSLFYFSFGSKARFGDFCNTLLDRFSNSFEIITN